jgi:hypothetical protein
MLVASCFHESVQHMRFLICQVTAGETLLCRMALAVLLLLLLLRAPNSITNNTAAVVASHPVVHLDTSGPA